MLYLLLCAVWLLRFLTGACCFSFLNVVVWRLPRGESLIRGRSHCPACGRVLAAWELVPCFSFLALRGRCHGCGAQIPRRDFWVEALGGVAFLGCAACFGGDSLQAYLVFAVLFLLTAVALMDWDTMEIDDRFHMGLLLCAAAAVWLFPQVSLAQRAVGAVCVSLPMLVLALVISGAFGGGDIKLMFALGLFLGWKRTLFAAFFAVFTGGIYAIYLLAAKKAGRKDHFPFGPFLCAGGAAALFFGDSVIAWYLSLW